MGDSKQENLEGPDLEKGVPLDQLNNCEPFYGHAHGEQVVLVRNGDSVFALSATCTHYGGPLQEGVVAGGQIRCPWHHAKFDLATGHATGPAVEPIGCYQVAFDDGWVKVGAPRTQPRPLQPPEQPQNVAIVGGGPAGAACAENLRRLGYEGPITIIADVEPFPVDRPNLSKDYLAGNAKQEWLPIRTPEFYEEHDINFVRDRVIGIDTEKRELRLDGGHNIPFDAALLATGASPRRLPIEGAELEHVHTLRSLQDSEEIIADIENSERAVVIGAGFIGLEVAASMRERGLDVTVVAPSRVPMEGVLGLELGQMVRSIHEEHGVKFELGKRPKKIDEEGVTLDSGKVLPADVVVIGIGVDPRTSLAEEAGLDVDDGVVVDEHLETSVEGIYAAGDIARFYRNGATSRVEHFAVAERQGQAAARSMLGMDGTFSDVPFFWSRHYDLSIGYVGHAPKWDGVTVHGSIPERNATVAFENDGRIDAVATVGRPEISLLAEIAMERGSQEELRKLVGAE